MSINLPLDARRAHEYAFISPTVIRSRNLSHVAATLLLQALFAVPQLRITLSKWRTDDQEILDYPHGSYLEAR